mmetsp:Transcript_8735/g.6468  ORF Transcript_8735/g.6468 Transcript_8735/m.6468 type:complete len:137 (-) Transcript_8735:213-623(-)|eukprot:CAMPEP_0202959994 /NCGR_PEP_ID=MMETSP1396-20130829/4181_1 /ASSEMBLY_ACC=CAM_ASM_000872 /TAXON_ID= /ORGANISM="Pseudokeronopsis sp., Strain Brazil" /LENGTH=136 /DNA_ID=CAMNT_0049678937 /DNA_START=1670 /DNA_END=2080 /DNA_ORIENTATION=+
MELVNYVLDLLHEDLNKVKKKPYVEIRDSEGRPDSEVSQEHWDAFIARNQSIIVDLMYGQLKSTVTCQACNYVSITFDPFLTLSVPIARPFKLSAYFVPRQLFKVEDGQLQKNEVKAVQLKLEKQATIGEFKELVA